MAASNEQKTDLLFKQFTGVVHASQLDNFAISTDINGNTLIQEIDNFNITGNFFFI